MLIGVVENQRAREARIYLFVGACDQQALSCLRWKVKPGKGTRFHAAVHDGLLSNLKRRFKSRIGWARHHLGEVIDSERARVGNAIASGHSDFVDTRWCV